jgi:hypothetical protein|tara:strand:+ start:85 stop:864 length:780 start_codon:yes stop_codon:yes gene_type:complete
MGIFDWLFGKKETPSEPKKDCCSKKEKKKDNFKESILRIHSDDLEDIDGISHYQKIPFTGVYYNLYLNGNLSFESEQVNGKDHGTSKRYKIDGTIHSIVNFSNDKIHNEDQEKDNEFQIYLMNQLISQEEKKLEEIKKKKTTKTKISKEEKKIVMEEKWIKKWIVKVDHMYFSNNFVIEGFELHDCDWLDEDNWEYGDILDDGTMYNGEVVDYDTLCTIMEEKDIEHIDSSEENLHFLDTLEEGRKKYNELIKNTWSEG